MGGALSIASGVLVPEVDAVVAFYGTPSSELADPSKAKAPIQAHFGEHDSFVGFSDVTVRLYAYTSQVTYLCCYGICQIYMISLSVL
jgi:dienelactone hydrolase